MAEWKPTQAVLVDDTDPRIHYEGSGWTPDTSGATNSWGVYGPTYKNTLHQARGDVSLWFSFEGSEVEVLGTLRTLGGYPRPSWICTVDKKSSGRVDAWSDNHTNHWSICNTAVSGPGPHTLTLNITVPEGGLFWIDRISFSPNSMVTSNETIRVQDNDANILYSTNWNATEDIVHLTDIPGETLTFKFTGTSVSAFGMLPPNLTDSQGTWSIDGGEATAFTIPGHEGLDPMFNAPIFATGNFTPEEHTLVVTYTGKQGATPLSIDFFNVDLPPSNGSEASGASESSSVSATSDPSPTPSSPTSGSKSSNAGAIAGGVVGGVVGLALLLLLALFLRRRRLRRQMEEEKGLAPEPFVKQSPNQPLSTKIAPVVLSAPKDDSITSPTTSASASSAIVKQEQAIAAANATPPVQPVQHVDSGVRMHEASGSSTAQPEIRDIPPQYTEH